MLRQREKTVSFQAGALSIAVHGGLLLALLISFNWKTTHPVTIAEVELWDRLPAPVTPKVVPPAAVVEPEVKELVKLEPVVDEQPKNDVQVDIVLEKKLKALAKEKALEKFKQEKELLQKKKLAEIQAALLKDDLQANEKALKDKKTREQNEVLKKLQQETLADDQAVGEQQASSAKAAANAGVVGEFQNKIRAKIRGNVNKTLCGTGNPELKFDIGLLPTGQLSGAPILIKSSGSVACDEAVERAIMASEPLPLPKDTSLFSQFRDLKLTFRPNDT